MSGTQTFYEWTEERLNGSIDFAVDFADRLEDLSCLEPPSSKHNEVAVRVGISKLVFKGDEWHSREYCYFLRVTKDGKIWRNFPKRFSHVGYEHSQNGSKIPKRFVRELEDFVKSNSIGIAGEWLPADDTTGTSRFRLAVNRIFEEVKA